MLDLLFEWWPLGDADGGNFLKKISWSPDGACILSSSEDRKLATLDFGQDSSFLNFVTDAAPAMQSAKQAETIHDIQWYPWMRRGEAASCCFIACTRDHPLHLHNSTDANLGVRCTYVAIDHLDQVATPYCCAFSPDGGRIFAGCKRDIQMFDSLRPGRAVGRLEGLSAKSGPISSLTSRRDSNYILAAGTFGGQIGIFDPRLEDPLLMKLDGEHREGITQVEFAPDGWTLFSVARREREIIQWDLRSPDVSVVHKYGPRESTTNQRLYFAVNESNLYSGDQLGNLLRFDLLPEGGNLDPPSTIEPTYLLPAANLNSTNCVSTHGHLLASSHGQRLFDAFDDPTTSKTTVAPSLKIWKINENKL